MQEYRFKPGSRFAVPAQLVGDRLAALTAVNGHVTAPEVVEDARPADAQLHRLFEWDDSVAGEKFRIEQARHVIRSVHPVHVDAQGHPRPVLGWVHVDLPDEGPCYVSTARAVSEPELQEQVEADAIKAFEALSLRYEHLASLRGFFAELDRALEAVKAQRKTIRKRPVAADAGKAGAA